MIRVTRLNHAEIIVNAEMIEFVEATPDTMITLESGKRLMVAEPVDVVVERVIEYRRRCAQVPGSDAERAP
jgi:flagellar protein FlbD